MARYIGAILGRERRRMSWRWQAPVLLNSLRNTVRSAAYIQEDIHAGKLGQLGIIRPLVARATLVIRVAGARDCMLP